jgi:hypothetical protein
MRQIAVIGKRRMASFVDTPLKGEQFRVNLGVLDPFGGAKTT